MTSPVQATAPLFQPARQGLVRIKSEPRTLSPDHMPCQSSSRPISPPEATRKQDSHEPQPKRPMHPNFTRKRPKVTSESDFEPENEDQDDSDEYKNEIVEYGAPNSGRRIKKNFKRVLTLKLKSKDGEGQETQSTTGSSAGNAIMIEKENVAGEKDEDDEDADMELIHEGAVDAEIQDDERIEAERHAAGHQPKRPEKRIMDIDWAQEYRTWKTNGGIIDHEEEAEETKSPGQAQLATKRKAKKKEPVMAIDWKLSEYEATMTTDPEDHKHPMAKISIPGMIREGILLTPETADLEFLILQSVFLPSYEASVSNSTTPPDPRLTLLNYHTISTILLSVYQTLLDETGTQPEDADPDEVFLNAIDNWRIGKMSQRVPYKNVRGVQEFCDVAMDIAEWVHKNGLVGLKKTKLRKQRRDKGVKRGPKVRDAAAGLKGEGKGKGQGQAVTKGTAGGFDEATDKKGNGKINVLVSKSKLQDGATKLGKKTAEKESTTHGGVKGGRLEKASRKN